MALRMVYRKRPETVPAHSPAHNRLPLERFVDVIEKRRLGASACGRPT